MARFIGTRWSDLLDATYEWRPALMHGRGGDDTLYGSRFADRIYGDNGHDRVHGGDGADRLYGGRGNDILSDFINPLTSDSSIDHLWGGYGNDQLVTGLGGDLAVGGYGNDDITLGGGGHAYGDQGPGLEQKSAGNDVIVTDLGNGVLEHREMTGGLGADFFHVTTVPDDNLRTTVTIHDFSREQGDEVEIGAVVLNNGVPSLPNPVQVMSWLDTNGDRRIDGTDGVGAFGAVFYDIGQNLLTIIVGAPTGDAVIGGDEIAVFGTDHITYDWPFI